MSTPTTPKLTFAEAAIRSGLIDERKYQRAVELAGSPDEAAVADTLIRSGLLTEYQAAQLRDGRTKLSLGPYLITDFIGQGGMGRVFKAVHRVMGRECAVKVLPLEKSTKESRDSFMNEIRVQAGLDNPFVVRAFDAGQDGNVHYLVTEYVPGTDLRKMIRNRTRDGEGALPMDEAALVISQAARGLHYAHELGLVHRDIKPGNILVTPDGHAKLSDIGLAAWSMCLENDPRAGKIVGTADYLSPEQIRDPFSVGPLSDIYSLGCTMYYTVTGKVPFPGGDSKSKCRRHCEETPWHPRNLAPDLSEDFVDTIADMMEKEPARRIASALEVAERLEPWASANIDPGHGPMEGIQASPPWQRQAWTPPPPPHEPAQLRESLREGTGTSGSETLSQGGESTSGVASDSAQSSKTQSSKTQSSKTQSSDTAVGDWDPNVQVAPKPSHTMAIAVTLAIAVPLSLLVGAILGFIMRGELN